MALAIQTVAQRVKLKHKEKTVQDFRYRDKEWEQLFLDALSNVSFEGVTVRISFCATYTYRFWYILPYLSRKAILFMHKFVYFKLKKKFCLIPKIYIFV